MQGDIPVVDVNPGEQVSGKILKRGSYMSAHVLLNLLNKLGKRDKMRGFCQTFYLFSATSLINSIIQEH